MNVFLWKTTQSSEKVFEPSWKQEQLGKSPSSDHTDHSIAQLRQGVLSMRVIFHLPEGQKGQIINYPPAFKHYKYSPLKIENTEELA